MPTFKPKATKKIKHDEIQENKKYVQMVIDQDNKHKNDQKEKEEKLKKQLKDVQKFQRI